MRNLTPDPSLLTHSSLLITHHSSLITREGGEKEAVVAAARGAVGGEAQRAEGGAGEEVVDAQQGQAVAHYLARRPGVGRAVAGDHVGVPQTGGQVVVGRLAVGDVEVAQE